MSTPSTPSDKKTAKSNRAVFEERRAAALCTGAGSDVLVFGSALVAFGFVIVVTWCIDCCGWRMGELGVGSVEASGCLGVVGGWWFGFRLGLGLG